MSALRKRVQEITDEYWAVREEQSERVATAQLILVMAGKEAELERVNDALQLIALARQGHLDSRQFYEVLQEHARVALAGSGIIRGPLVALEALAAELERANEALRQIADVNTDDPIRDAAGHRRIARAALAASGEEQT